MQFPVAQNKPLKSLESSTATTLVEYDVEYLWRSPPLISQRRSSGNG